MLVVVVVVETLEDLLDQAVVVVAVRVGRTASTALLVRLTPEEVAVAVVDLTQAALVAPASSSSA
jgi:hypothetical protein